jgi:hypothetical protein
MTNSLNGAHKQVLWRDELKVKGCHAPPNMYRRSHQYG